MLIFEAHARLLIVVHGVIGAALVAVSTHLAVWTWRIRKNPHFRRGALRFAAICAALYALELILGNVLYPTYKIRVRAEFLDNPQAISRDLASRATAGARIAEAAPAIPDSAPAAPGANTARAVPPEVREATIRRNRTIARIFDVKEHLVALGLALALACPVLLWAADPSAERRTVATTARVLTLLVAAITWFAAVVGLTITTIRSV
ncbi:MAG TPA: hypothetical protein VFG83_10925 [Kofleriaceae bacterium]|nr:hypothetical protein [Kofleriaceae bacterium]